MIELLAPAGDLERLKIAISYGADAVYIGGKKFSLRARASNFELKDIREGCEFAHSHGAKVYVTMNVVPHDDDFEGLEDYLLALDSFGVDGIIVTSFKIAEVAKRLVPQIERHLSTQFSVSNSETIEFLRKWGFSRFVLAREVGLEQIRQIRSKTETDLEVFIHGGMCVSYSGRCMLSNHMTNRDANRGGCAHSCRWNYSLFSNGKNLNLDDVFFSMGSRDLCAVSAIPELIDLGVKSLKIEGRMKSLYYIATVVRGYRMLIDDYLKNPDNFDVSKYKDEIAKAENRATGTGFLFHRPGVSEQVYNNENLMPTKEFIGLVLDYDPKTQTATVQERNYFKIGDEVEFFGPKSENQRMIIKEMWDETTVHLLAARHALQVVKMKVDFPVSSGDLIRKLPRIGRVTCNQKK